MTLVDSGLDRFVQALHGHHCYCPHDFLGLHGDIIRTWRPGASELFVEVEGKVHPMDRVDDRGLFALRVPEGTHHHNYRIFHSDGRRTLDPYVFSPSFGEMDQHLFSRGIHYNLYELLGARLCTHEGVAGARVTVWAPNATGVELLCDRTHWRQELPMRNLGGCGVWELFVPEMSAGEKYKFAIFTRDGRRLEKTDPAALAFEHRPKSAAIVTDMYGYTWGDDEWMEKRRWTRPLEGPLNIYEVHLGSWRDCGGYYWMACELAAYCKQMGYTHVELLPITEHPLDESWGYQVTGYFAPTSRFGSFQDFQAFVDTLHRNGIGVILDWVPGHFPNDAFGLAQFDGTYLFEHANPLQRHHPHWGTHIFNLGRAEVSNFLISNAVFWLEHMHIDGLRVDAVASMLYRDYGREGEQWVPNQYGGREDLESIEFLKHLNAIVHQRCPGTLMIAEESSAFPAVTQPVDQGGLGFDLKWNMGWMNDTLSYFEVDPFFRRYHQNKLTFGQMYAYSEKFVLVLSHDEVVHGKCSLLNKMPGDQWQQFANLRLLLSYMTCQPGKKLLFQSGEIGQWNEWNCKSPVEWHLLDHEPNRQLHRMVAELNHIYLANPALYERDHDSSGFEWIDFSDTHNSVLVYLRKASSQTCLCIHNFTPNYHHDYRVPVHGVKRVELLFSSDAADYGGSGKGGQIPSAAIGSDYLEIELPPLATLIYTIER